MGVALKWGGIRILDPQGGGIKKGGIRILKTRVRGIRISNSNVGKKSKNVKC